ncbi:hypothetical protein O5268_12785 [Escherichia coli]|nr:hypothetical protein [Escherichia coli]
MLSRIKANYGWSAWWQFAGKPLSEYPGTYLFTVTTAAVRYLQEVSGSTLTPQRAGTWLPWGNDRERYNTISEDKVMEEVDFITAVRNAAYNEYGAITCEVQFEGAVDTRGEPIWSPLLPQIWMLQTTERNCITLW